MKTLESFLKQIREEQPIYTPEYFSNMSEMELYRFLEDNKQYHFLGEYNDELIICSSGYLYPYGAKLEPTFYEPFWPGKGYNIDFSECTEGGEFGEYWSYEEALKFLDKIYYHFGIDEFEVRLSSMRFFFDNKSAYIGSFDVDTIDEENFVRLLDHIFSFCVFGLASTQFGYRAQKYNMGPMDYEEYLKGKV